MEDTVEFIKIILTLYNKYRDFSGDISCNKATFIDTLEAIQEIDFNPVVELYIQSLASEDN